MAFSTTFETFRIPYIHFTCIYLPNLFWIWEINKIISMMNRFIIWEVRDVLRQKHFIQKQLNCSMYNGADQLYTCFFHIYQMQLFFFILSILYLFVYIHTSPPNTKATDCNKGLGWSIFRITALIISCICSI